MATRALKRTMKRTFLFFALVTVCFRFCGETLPLSRVSSRLHMITSFYRHCSSCCEVITKDLVLTKRLASTGKNIVCLTLDERRTRLKIIARGRRRINRGYLYSAATFLEHVRRSAIHKSRRLHAVKGKFELVWVIEDDASLPQNLVHELQSRKIPLLVHSVPMTFSSPASIFVPNFHFIKQRGFRLLMAKLRQSELPFAERDASVYWRGATTGVLQTNRVDNKTSIDGDCRKLTRVKAATVSSSVPWLDVAVTKPVQLCKFRAAMNSRVAMAQYSPEIEWIRHKGLLEMDGNVDAWGHGWRMASGSVVFLVRSDYKHYFSGLLVEGVHYIGVRRDLSDLIERTKVITQTDNATVAYLSQVAANARALMRELEYDEVVERVAQSLLWENE
jgi:hypothetical protein